MFKFLILTFFFLAKMSYSQEQEVINIKCKQIDNSQNATSLNVTIDLATGEKSKFDILLDKNSESLQLYFFEMEPEDIKVFLEVTAINEDQSKIAKLSLFKDILVRSPLTFKSKLEYVDHATKIERDLSCEVSE